MRHNKIDSQKIDGADGRRIAQIDGWRGISILLVVTGHLVILRYGDSPLSGPITLASTLAELGVRIFFVISGFIITTMALRERLESGRFSATGFYTRRLFRIVPPFAIFLVFVWGATEFGMIQSHLNDILFAAGFMCNLPGVVCGFFTSHTWSLAYEEQFYLLFPLLFIFRMTRIKIFILCLFILLMAFPFIAHALQLSERIKEAASFADRGFLFICAGALAAVYMDRIKLIFLSRWASLTYWCALAVLIFILLLHTHPQVQVSASLFAYLSKGLNITLLPVCIAWLVGSSVFHLNPLARLLESPPLQFLGMISYSLYLWQQIFSAHPSYYLTNNWLLFPPLMLLMATLSYYLVELPCIRVGKLLVNTATSKHRRL